MNRYLRQMQFSAIGEEGQKKLATAKVALIGCGGLGSTLAQCMARSGVGSLTVIDGDRVDITNLHRQFLFDNEDAKQGTNKALATKAKLDQWNPEALVTAAPSVFSPENADSLLSGHDLVLDGVDRMSTRYIINDWCVKHKTPWIYGGVVGATGMTMVILPGKGPCLRCIFPDPEKESEEEIAKGVINTIPTFIASIQVTEAIKLIVNSPNVILDLRIFDLWSGDTYSVPGKKNPACPCCGKGRFDFL